MKRSKFSLSYYRLLSCKMGQLVPIGLMEVLPGDTIQHNSALLLRSLQLLAPLMHPVTVKVHHWFVPHRLVWNDWEDFITGGRDGLNASTFPTITLTGGSDVTSPGVVALGSLGDYLGTQAQGAGTQTVSALPFRGYSLIWNEWYRDGELQTPLTIDLTDGTDTTTNTVIQSAGWEKDYFTSSRPQPKLGPSTTVPLTGNADVIAWSGAAAPNPGRMRVQSTGNVVGAQDDVVVDSTGNTGVGAVGASTDVYYDPNGTLFANLGANPAAGLTVAALRETLAIQRYQEARSRYGSRYTEYLRYLNVRSSDARLQVPEYLGGGRSPVQFSEVLQTATGGDGVGTMRGHGISTMRTNRYRRFFEEHGYVYSLLCIRPKGIYTQGIPRHWNRRTKEDYWQKELEHIGQQEILNKELYSLAASPDATFGYQDRYDEYRRNESGVAGNFRDSLDHWHMARVFTATPVLNSAFITCDPTTRVYPITNEDTVYVMANHSIQARRLVSRSATPRTF